MGGTFLKGLRRRRGSDKESTKYRHQKSRSDSISRKKAKTEWAGNQETSNTLTAQKFRRETALDKGKKAEEGTVIIQRNKIHCDLKQEAHSEKRG